MNYKISEVSEKFGHGVRIEAGRDTYEQFICKEGLVARVFSNSLNGFDGIVFRGPFTASSHDYEQFSNLTERLEDLSGEKTPHLERPFMDYISRTGLEQRHSAIEATIKINLKDKEPLPESSEKWLNLRAHWAGAVIDALAYSAGVILSNHLQLGSEYEDAKTFTAYIAFPALEFTLGFAPLCKSEDNYSWIGPIHAIGFWPVKSALSKKLRSANYILEKFQKANKRFEEFGTSVNYPAKFAKLSKQTDRYFKILEDLFLFTEYQKGFSISYKNPSRNNVIDFLDYILEGGSIPSLSSPSSSLTSKPKEAKPSKLETEVQQPLPNPWDVKIPTVENLVAGGGR